MRAPPLASAAAPGDRPCHRRRRSVPRLAAARQPVLAGAKAAQHLVFWFVLMAASGGQLRLRLGLTRLALNERKLVSDSRRSSQQRSEQGDPGGGAAGATTSFECCPPAGAVRTDRHGAHGDHVISAAVLLSLPCCRCRRSSSAGCRCRDPAARVTYGWSSLPDPRRGRSRPVLRPATQGDRALVQRVRNRLARHRKPMTNMPRLLIDERDVIRRHSRAGAGGRRCSSPRATPCSTTALCSPPLPLWRAAARLARAAGLRGGAVARHGAAHTWGFGSLRSGLAATLGLAGVGVARRPWRLWPTARGVLATDPGGRSGLRALPATVRPAGCAPRMSRRPRTPVHSFLLVACPEQSRACRHIAGGDRPRMHGR